MIERILGELKNLELVNPICPTDEVKPSDKVIGTLPDRIKKIFLLSNKYKGRIDKIITTEKPTPANIQKVTKLLATFKLLNQLLWVEIKDEFKQHNLWDPAVIIRVRAGWQVVIENEEQEIDILHSLIGALAAALSESDEDEEDEEDDLDKAINEFNINIQ